MQIFESELQIKLEKATREVMWSDLGVLLPGNAEITPRCNDTLGENQYTSQRYLTVQIVHAESLLKNLLDCVYFSNRIPAISCSVVNT